MFIPNLFLIFQLSLPVTALDLVSDPTTQNYNVEKTVDYKNFDMILALITVFFASGLISGSWLFLKMTMKTELKDDIENTFIKYEKKLEELLSLKLENNKMNFDQIKITLETTQKQIAEISHQYKNFEKTSEVMSERVDFVIRDNEHKHRELFLEVRELRNHLTEANFNIQRLKEIVHNISNVEI